MRDLQTRLKALLQVIEKWLSPDNKYLQRSIAQTVEEGFFNRADVEFALKTLQRNVHKKTLNRWVDLSEITDQNDARGQNVLCLHAGNLPLVGFQDALAVLLSGARYTGKISRKDPYLLPAFLNEVKKTELWGSTDVQWSHRLNDFEDMQHHKVLFAGSRQSIIGVKKAIKALNLKKDEGQYLIRTAHFSMAYFDEKSGTGLGNLAESILRYGGKGCRSVGVVVSPFALHTIKEELDSCIQSFRSKNPQHATPAPKLRQRYAYNQAIERSQLWLDDFLIQENGLEMDQDFICYWVQGKQNKVSMLAERFGDQVQTIYTNRADVTIPDLPKTTELERLGDAQQPPIYWKPDGTDTLKWLCRSAHV